MSDDTPRVLGMTWVDLADALLCIDCEITFDRRSFTACPRCARASVVLLATFLQERPVARDPRGVDGERRVRLGDVLHHAGNALTPARLYAQAIAEQSALRGGIGPAFSPALERQIARDAARIVDAIDEAIARLRALVPPPPCPRPISLVKESPHGAAQDR